MLQNSLESAVISQREDDIGKIEKISGLLIRIGDATSMSLPIMLFKHR
jgi:hypothetical protein